LLALDLVDEVGNGAIKIPSVDSCEEPSEHANAKTLPVENEANLRFPATSVGER
jgi:hypothetical protein